MTCGEAIAKGYVYYCLECRKVYKAIPPYTYEDGHGGRSLEACTRCGCDLFGRLT
jgi:hypothetical protein